MASVCYDKAERYFPFLYTKAGDRLPRLKEVVTERILTEHGSDPHNALVAEMRRDSFVRTVILDEAPAATSETEDLQPEDLQLQQEQVEVEEAQTALQKTDEAATTSKKKKKKKAATKMPTPMAVFGYATEFCVVFLGTILVADAYTGRGVMQIMLGTFWPWF